MPPLSLCISSFSWHNGQIIISLIRFSPLSTPPTSSLVTSDMTGASSRRQFSLKDCICIEIVFSYSALLSDPSTFMLILRQPFAIRFVNSISSDSVKYGTTEDSNFLSFLDFKILSTCSGSLALLITVEFVNLSPPSKRLLMEISKTQDISSKISTSGMARPVSHLLTACVDTLNFSASSACDSPNFLRKMLIRFPNCSLSIIIITPYLYLTGLCIV